MFLRMLVVLTVLGLASACEAPPSWQRVGGGIVGLEAFDLLEGVVEVPGSVGGALEADEPAAGADVLRRSDASDLYRVWATFPLSEFDEVDPCLEDFEQITVTVTTRPTMPMERTVRPLMRADLTGERDEEFFGAVLNWATEWRPSGRFAVDLPVYDCGTPTRDLDLDLYWALDPETTFVR